MGGPAFSECRTGWSLRWWPSPGDVARHRHDHRSLLRLAGPAPRLIHVPPKPGRLVLEPPRAVPGLPRIRGAGSGLRRRCARTGCRTATAGGRVRRDGVVPRAVSPPNSSWNAPFLASTFRDVRCRRTSDGNGRPEANGPTASLFPGGAGRPSLSAWCRRPWTSTTTGPTRAARRARAGRGAGQVGVPLPAGTYGAHGVRVEQVTEVPQVAQCRTASHSGSGTTRRRPLDEERLRSPAAAGTEVPGPFENPPGQPAPTPDSTADLTSGATPDSTRDTDRGSVRQHDGRRTQARDRPGIRPKNSSRRASEKPPLLKPGLGMTGAPRREFR